MHSPMLVALFIAAVTAVPTNHQSQRIVGGQLASIEDWPEMVALLYNWTELHMHEYGGIILNYRSVLTAAHCFYWNADFSRWRMRVGSTYANSGGTVYYATQIIIHAEYQDLGDNDIAIMRSASPFTFNDNVRAAFIAGPNYNVIDHQVVWATGWGATQVNGRRSEELREVQTWTINQEVCRELYSVRGKVITDNMLCSGWLNVGGHGTCTGDSGGLLYHNGVVIGISSAGGGCGDAEFYDVNTRVSRYTSWIQNNA